MIPSIVEVGFMTSFSKSILCGIVLVVLAASALAQDKPDKTTGIIKGKVRVERGSPSGVAVILIQGDNEITRVQSDKKGDFAISHVVPGTYSIRFRKPGLMVGTIDDIAVKAGQTRPLGDRLYLTVDPGSIALINVSVFDEAGHSIPDVRVDLAKIIGDDRFEKIDTHMTDESGSFVFRLSPAPAKYRLTIMSNGAEQTSQDVLVEQAARYAVALTYKKKS
jgi:Carboxypeptidase regulatory-like domain